MKEEMDAAVKAAQAEARSKCKPVGTKPAPKAEMAKPAESFKPALPPPAEPSKVAGLFDASVRPGAPITDPDEEEEVLEAEQFTPECDADEAT